jgi:ABC-2 type transport system ATP-binding protein
MNETVIEIRNLCIEYGQHTAVRNLSLSVRRGEVYGFVGPNGAGKSSTIRALLGFNRIAGGEISILGVDARDEAARARLGYLPETPTYYDFLTPVELLDSYARLFGMSADDRRIRIAELLAQVGLADHAKKRIGKFSKGMQQRLGLAQAMLNDPELLILDEPASGLDPLGRQKIRQLIESMKARGRTVFFSSHELSEIETVCDRVGMLVDGELKVEGEPGMLSGKHGVSLERVFINLAQGTNAEVTENER